MQVLSLNDVRNQRETILTIAERHGAANVRVFGSVVRGEARSKAMLTSSWRCAYATARGSRVGYGSTCRNSWDAMRRS